MMRKSYAVSFFAMLLGLAGSAMAGGWTEFKSDAKYGFSMLVPEGATGEAKDFGDGWGGLYFKVGDVQVAGIAKLGGEATEEDFHAFVAKTTGIAADHWTPIASGTGENWHGFSAVQSFHATDGTNSLWVGMGAGPKGSYVMYVLTPNATYEANKADFDKWIDSIHVE